MAPTWLFFTFIWVLLTPSLRVKSEQLSGTEETGTRIFQRCKGSNVTLNEPDHRVTVLHVFVFLGRESLASSSVPATGSFEKRLTVDNDGRVTLTNLTSDDLGRYRVEVQAEDKVTYNIRLVIKEPPETADGKLFVMKNTLSDRNSIRLMCGTVTTLGFPPVSAVWKDPAGRTLSSDGFKDQYFYLDVPADTADSGDYCCQLDCRAPDFCCLDDQSPLRSCARISVQTDKKVESATDERVSLGNFTQAMAYLVHRQARCDQLDAYITKVETLEVDMLKGIDNMRNTTTESRIHLERETNQKLWNFQLQMNSNASKVMESCNVCQQQLMTTVSDKLLTLEMKLNKGLLELHNATSTADGRLESNMNRSVEHLQKLQLQLDTTTLRSIKSLYEIQERLTKTTDGLERNFTTVADKVKTLGYRLDKDGGFERKLTRALDEVKDLRQRLDKDGKLEGNLTRISDKVEALGQKLDNDLAELRSTSSQTDKEIKTNMALSLDRIQARMQEIVKEADEHQSRIHKQITNLKTEELATHEQKISSEMSKLETNVTQLMSTFREAVTLNLTNIQQTLAELTSTSQFLLSALEKEVWCSKKKGYVWYIKTCLKISMAWVNYTTAKADCEADGAHLYDKRYKIQDTRYKIQETLFIPRGAIRK